MRRRLGSFLSRVPENLKIGEFKLCIQNMLDKEWYSNADMPTIGFGNASGVLMRLFRSGGPSLLRSVFLLPLRTFYDKHSLTL